MIIWSGLGFFVPGICLVSFYVMQVAIASIFSDPEYYREHTWPKFLACLMASALVGVFGWWLSKGRGYTDETTGQKVIVRRHHSFFFIPVTYWAAIIAVFGIVAIFL